MKILLHTLGLLFVIAWSSVAWAEGDADLSQEYFDRGAGLYVEGKYGEALVQFKRGNDEAPNPMFPYSMALCSLKLGRYQEALRSAIDAKTQGGLGNKQGAQNDARIAVIPRIETGIAIAEAIRPAQPDLPEPAPDLVVNAPREKRGFGAIGWIGVGTTVVGTGLLVGALVSELALQTKWDEFNRAAVSGDEARFLELKDEIERSQTTGMILLYGGAGVTAIGLTLVIVGLVTSGADKPATAGFYVLPDGSFGGNVSLRF